ncbi:unnamed protein product [Larinioides sclopetarius]
MFPHATKDNIAKILQFYDDDESKAVDGLTRDGGREALSNWADSSSSKSKNNKNKKKKKKAKKDSGAGITATASFDADDSSSLHSGGNVEADVEKECPRTENGNGILSDAVDDPAHLDRMLSDRLSCNELEPEGQESEKENKFELKLPQERNSPTAPEAVPISLNCDRTLDTISSCISPPSDSSERQEEQVVRKEKYRSSNESSSKPSPRQRTSSFRRSKSSSISEDSSSQHNPQTAAAPTKRGFDKCKKDLNRQTISLQRIYALVEKGFEDASKKSKTQFSEIQKIIEKRQKEIEAELNERKQEAFNLCKSRQDLAVELKRRLDRTASLSETEWTELRSDVKQFVTERKYDDELGKTIWFQWEDISQVISNFGEVPPVKNVYSQRSHSALGHSGASNNPEPSPSSSLANEENESSADKNDVGNISDTAEDETPVPEKEEVPVFTKPHPIENRTRVYSNSNKQYERLNRGRFNSNRGSGYFHGNRGGGGYNRPNYRGNYQYNRHSNYDNHSYGDRDGRTNNGSVYFADRNINNNRDNKLNRNQGRGHMNYRNNNPRYNRGGHRFNAEPAETEPTASASNANIDKTSVVNGYVNSNN